MASSFKKRKKKRLLHNSYNQEQQPLRAFKANNAAAKVFQHGLNLPRILKNSQEPANWSF